MEMALQAVDGPRVTARRYAGLLFCAGCYAMLAQILLLRELLVAFYGNELTIGALLSVWLAVTGAGSLAIRPLLRRRAWPGLGWGLTGLLLLLAAALPAQVWLIRIIRAVLHVPYGEYAPFGAMLAGTSLALLPTCLGIGLIFPCACHLAGPADSRSVGRLYAMEALGSMLGGALFTFVFAQWLTPWTIMALAALAAAAGAAAAAPGILARRLLILPVLILAAAAAQQWTAGLEWKSIEARWRAFGCLPAARGAADGAARLLASTDTRYQNLALIAAQGQTTLYGNGQVLAVFPDPIAGEHKINFILAQNPAARSVLLIGGNPVTDLPELLKYPLRRLVHVELDGAISRLLDQAGGPEYRRAVRDPRFVQAVADGPRFVKNTRELFDVIIVDAPDPTTIALNRFYTLDFYQAAQRRLTAGGFLTTSIEASELLQGEAAGLSASIHHTLQQVFPRILVTGGPRNRYFAGRPASQLTFDRQVLFQRSAATGLRHRYFRPEYFLNADEISPDKTAFVAQRLASLPAPVNTALRPIATHYHLLLWSRFSGSRLEGMLQALGRIHFKGTLAGLGIVGALLLLIGAGLGARRQATAGNSRRLWTRSMLGLVMASTGFCGMALELILVYMFQSLLGYIYARIGLIVAVFMLGLMLGALSAGRRTVSARDTWRVVLELDGLLLGLAVSLPFLADACLQSAALAGSVALVEGLIDGLILLAGWAVGAQFIAINHLLRDTGAPLGSAAALANAADLFGAASGGLAVGVILLPLWGMTPACLLLAAVKGVSAAMGCSARLTGWKTGC